MPKGTGTKLAYRLSINADGVFREGPIQLMRSEIVVHQHAAAIESLNTARTEGKTIDVYFDAHNQNGMSVIRGHFAKTPAAAPETPVQPLES